MANIFLDMLQRKGSREISLLSLIWGVLTFSDKKTINDEVFQETNVELSIADYYIGDSIGFELPIYTEASNVLISLGPTSM